MWLIAIVCLGALGIGVQDRLHSTNVQVPGTAAAKAGEFSDQALGESQQLLVLVEGPATGLEREAHRLAGRLEDSRGVGVVDAWRSGLRELLPTAERAILLVSVHKSFEAVSKEVPDMRSELRALVKAPYRVYLTGYTDIAEALHLETVSAIERGELIAAIPLVIVLILVLGAPFAAAIPLFLGGSVALGGWGLLDLINSVTPLDASGLALATMMGLALGVDYSLLMVTRFRSELARGASVNQASRIASSRAGRTVCFAAAALAATMMCSLLLIPATVLKSAVIGVLAAVVLAVIGATVVLPPLLRLGGEDLNAFQLLPTATQSNRWRRLGDWVLRRPKFAALGSLGVLLALCIPVLGFPSGGPDPSELPPGSAARQDFEAIAGSIGGSYAVPLVVTAVGRPEAPTTRDIGALTSFNRELGRDRQTLAVFGSALFRRPDPVTKRFERPLRRVGIATGYLSPRGDPRGDGRTAASGSDGRPGYVAQLVVVQRGHGGGGGSLPTEADNPYYRSLKTRTAKLGRELGATAVVGGPAATLGEFDDAVNGRLPLLIVALVLIAYVGLSVMLRNWVLPAIAIALNVLTVGVAFGVLTLAFGGDRVLGGPGYVDDVMAAVIFTVAFALSLDYEIFLLDRMREGYYDRGSVNGAILYGLENTAGVITGAAAIMIAVFLAFTISPMPTLRELGVGLSVAVALDATLVRLVLLPAALRLAGDRAWASFAKRWS